jgi:hypothetical protein
MKIREGAYYRTRGGDVVGPMLRYAGRDDTFTAIGHTWYEDGSFVRGNPCKTDLISEVYVSDTPPSDKPEPETKTLRDEFAMAALQGMLARDDFHARDVARDAYEYAYEMMEARKK